MTASPWTDDLREKVKALWATRTASEISGVLWEEDRISLSRNAIIGLLHRLNLTSKDIQSRVKTVRAPRPPRAESSRTFKVQPDVPRIPYEPVETVQLRCVEIVPRHLSVIDLEKNDCRWPYGDETITFCGHPKIEGSSYCVPHFHLSRGERRALRGIAA